MEKKKIYLEVEKLLNDWDPIGILQEFKPINYYEGTTGEYSRYVEPIIEVYNSKESIYNYMIELQTDLLDYPNEKMKEKIKVISERIVKFLSEQEIEGNLGG